MADNSKPAKPFTSGMPAVSVKAEPQKYPCTGKLTVEKKVSYGSK